MSPGQLTAAHAAIPNLLAMGSGLTKEGLFPCTCPSDMVGSRFKTPRSFRGGIVFGPAQAYEKSWHFHQRVPRMTSPEDVLCDFLSPDSQ